jgi:hypothetical protein
MKISTVIKKLSVVATGATLITLAVAPQGKAISLKDWIGVGTFGTLGANGVVTLSPQGDKQYGYVSTDRGVIGVGLTGVGGSGSPANGSTVTSPFFKAKAGDVLKFYFNYVTSDGAGFSDYAWGRLLDTSLNQVSLLFTARTTPNGNTAPGFALPPLNATLTPATTPIIDGAPVWSPLGSDSGKSFSTGSGYTGWIQASYTIPTSGTFALDFGTVNWNDRLYQSGLAFDGASINGTPFGGDPPTTPEPSSLLGLLVLSGLGIVSLKRK